MLIPSREDCLDLMAAAEMPAHIREHSLRVAEIAVFLGFHLNSAGSRLHLGLLEAGGLLHDIGKERGLRTGENHARLGAAMLREWGLEAVAPIVESHIHIVPADLDHPLTESLIVNYADKRVRHHEVVTLTERFEDLSRRYGQTGERRAHLQRALGLFCSLEQKIFKPLAILPEDVL
jgi:putative nucleotidyltransferase with HDIG domain